MHQLIDKKHKIIIYFTFLLILSTTSTRFEKKSTSYFSKNNKINVKGLSIIHNQKILNELNNLAHHNIFFLGKEEIDRIISRYNIVDKYSVKKIYPKTLDINIKPTKFIAKLSNNRGLFVGANGKLIVVENDSKILPFIFGKFDSKNFLEFKKIINDSNFKFDDFKTIYFFSSNRWDVLTSNDILIKLPKENLLQLLNLAHKIISSNQLVDKNIIDLRVSNHLVIK
tara:strand:+ start:723 stop:1400 length:678 start_codon:yes stop_codon:yes gene_type:complete